jgi:hypothetical protein
VLAAPNAAIKMSGLCSAQSKILFINTVVHEGNIFDGITNTTITCEGKVVPVA